MLIYLREVLYATIKTVLRSFINIILYSFLSRIFHKWFGFHIGISFFCSMYCITKIIGYFQRLWLRTRIKNKKSDEKIILNQLSFESPNTLIAKINNDDNNNKFDNDWNFLLDDENKNIFSSIVNIPFSNGWLFFVTFIIIEYQMNNYHENYFISLIRTIIFILILICGSSIRYHTLYQREQKIFLDYMIKNPNGIERFIVYSNQTIPIASICLQIINSSDHALFMIQLYQINSKFVDYFYDIVNYICQNLIQSMKINGNQYKKSIHLIWSLPTCKKDWMYALKTNKFICKNSYKDFSFMPFVNSYIERYEYIYEYQDLSSDISDEKKKDQ